MSDFPVDIPADAGGDDGFDSEAAYEELLAPPDENLSIPKSKLQKLANENKNYRQRMGSYKPYAEAFGDAPIDDVKAIGAFYSALRSGDPAQIKAAQEWINSTISELTPAEQKAVNEAVREEAKATGQTVAEVKKDLTPEDIERMIEEKATKLYESKEAKKQEEAKVQENLNKMANLGKELAEEHGIAAWGDTNSRLYGMLIQATSQVMSQEGSNDVLEAMKKAAAVVLEDLQSVNVAVLSKKKQTAGAGAKASPKVGTEPVGQAKPQSFEDAGQRALRRIMADIGK